VTNAPQTYMLDGKQHVLVAVGDQLYAFRLNSSAARGGADYGMIAASAATNSG
jgi:hypothetical protein